MMYINHPLLILIICFMPTFPVQAQSISSEVGSASEEIAVRSIPNNRALTLTDCLRQALHHPRIEAAAKDVSVQEALEIQSGVLPNPVLEGEFENVLGTGELQAFDGIEATLAVSQLFERGGKRERRVQVAQWETRAAAWQYQQIIQDVLLDVAVAYINLQAAQEQVRLNEEFLNIQQNIYDVIRQRVEAGRDSPIEETRAKVLLASTRINLERAVRQLEQESSNLIHAMGLEQMQHFTVVGFQDEDVPPPPDLESLRNHLPQNPDLALWEAERKRREAVLSLEEAQAVPDVELAGGIRYLGESDDGAFMIGFSIPIPTFDRNQGAIRAAAERVEQVEALRQSERIDLLGQLNTNYQKMQQAYSEIQHLAGDIVPNALVSLEAVQEGFRQGKFSYLDVLDVQRSLYELENQRIEALQNYHLAWNQIKRLTNIPYTEDEIVVEQE
jgi:cobalt-zinc-cadmium efflux system outer membrane protein